MGEIRVFPGLIVEGESDKVTMKMVRMGCETQEAYIQRCQQIADFALSFVPKSEPPRFDPNDTSKYKKVGPSSWELIIPEPE